MEPEQLLLTSIHNVYTISVHFDRYNSYSCPNITGFNVFIVKWPPLWIIPIFVACPILGITFTSQIVDYCCKRGRFFYILMLEILLQPPFEIVNSRLPANIENKLSTKLLDNRTRRIAVELWNVVSDRWWIVESRFRKSGG